MRVVYWVSTAVFLAGVAAIWTGSMLIAAPAQVIESGKQYTLAEVARHARAGDCWMAISGSVYNLAAYLPLHPTAQEIIVPFCGKEATQAYQTKNRNRPHSPYANELLAKYRIGDLRQ
jgi:cytochrome b involved in lipid metabolism